MRKFILAIAALAGLAAVGAALGAFAIVQTLPPLEAIGERTVAESTKIYDRTGGVLLYEIHGEERRTTVPWEEIPDAVKQATIAIEDANFYNHPAFDWKSIVRALLVNLSRGGVVQGGSTITQQLAKKAFLSDERTLTRKIRELALSIQLERRFTKSEILELYLNQIPYGANAYGVESASRAYFGKSVRDASLAESALLAALPKAPSYYSPWGSHTDELHARKDRALDKMADLGFITAAERDAAKAADLAFAKPATNIRAPHFALAVVEELNREYGEDFVRTAGLTVRTTLDPKLQELAERVVQEGAARNEELYKGTNAALVAQDAKTGEVVALVGSRDYFDTARDGNFNVATQGLRQPGSAIKPFVYLTAFQKGYTPNTVLFDLETEFDTTGDPEKSYKPQNFDERFRGPVTLRQALAQSINVPSVKTLYLAGIPDVLQTAARFGITTLTDRRRYGLSLVLGGGEVKLSDLVGAYAVFAEEGVRHKQKLVLRVDRDGRALYEARDAPELVAEPQYARLVNDILTDADARSALFQNSLGLTVYPGHQVALKTGTTNDYRDAWAIGYTRSLVVGVWAGNNDNAPMERRGGSILAAVPIWNAFMKEALADRPLETFTRPEPTLTGKPVLDGEHLISYRSGDKLFPQLHDILFYVDRENPRGPEPRKPDADSQFGNWEEPVAAWGKAHVPDFLTAYNQPLPEARELARAAPAAGLPSLAVLAPQNGSFVAGPFEVAASLEAPGALARIDVLWNGTLLKTEDGLNGTSATFRTTVAPGTFNLQNVLRVVLWDKENRRVEQEIIVYK